MFFKINLIRSKALSPDKRKKVFSVITVYLLICILIFVFLFLKVGASLISMGRFRKEVLSLEKRFQRSSKQRNISEYHEEMRTEVAQYLNRLKAVDNVLSKGVDATQILVKISEALPRGSYVDNFNLDNDKKKLDFNIVSPIGKKGEAVNISKLIAIWKKDKALMSAIENITSSHSQRQKKGQDMVLISQFSCILSEGGVN
ncbi:hypothetical protein ACFL2J_01615 [Candidatus Omnitrophota bacterium]